MHFVSHVTPPRPNAPHLCEWSPPHRDPSAAGTTIAFLTRGRPTEDGKRGTARVSGPTRRELARVRRLSGGLRAAAPPGRGRVRGSRAARSGGGARAKLGARGLRARLARLRQPRRAPAAGPDPRRVGAAPPRTPRAALRGCDRDRTATPPAIGPRSRRDARARPPCTWSGARGARPRGQAAAGRLLRLGRGTVEALLRRTVEPAGTPLAP